MTPASKALDQYFTPPKLASELLDAVTIENPSKVGDFAVGDGELLRAAIDRWPSINCIANDIDSEVIGLLRVQYPKWEAFCFDFFDSGSLKNNQGFEHVQGSFPLITLNPPFSTKGKAYKTVVVEGTTARCSIALAFVVEASRYLQKGGQLVAILPYGIIHSEKNRKVRELLEAYYGFEVIKAYSNAGFAKCNPRTVIVRLTAGDPIKESQIVKGLYKKAVNQVVSGQISIQRGGVPNSFDIAKNPGCYPFIHTTNLKNNRVTGVERYAGGQCKTVTGPGVLIPRVGRPSVDKVVLLQQSTTLVLTECIFLIECNDVNTSKSLHNYIVQNWDFVKNYYTGTCACYISAKQLINCLRASGFEVLPSGRTVRNTDTMSKRDVCRKSIIITDSMRTKPQIYHNKYDLILV